MLVQVFTVIGLEAVLLTLADPEVRRSPPWQVGLLAMGLGALTLGCRVADVLGLPLLAEERTGQNDAGLIARGGFWLGLSCCVAGANIGHGEELNSTIFPLIMSMAAFCAFLLALVVGSNGLRLLILERERSAGARVGTVLSCAGALLGHAAAGDWVSWEATRRDYVHQVPALLFLAAASATIERYGRPTEQTRRPTTALVTGAICMGYLLVTIIWIRWTPHST